MSGNEVPNVDTDQHVIPGQPFILHFILNYQSIGPWITKIVSLVPSSILAVRETSPWVQPLALTQTYTWFPVSSSISINLLENDNFCFRLNIKHKIFTSSSARFEVTLMYFKNFIWKSLIWYKFLPLENFTQFIVTAEKYFC